jgi:hypothetical protein
MAEVEEKDDGLPAAVEDPPNPENPPVVEEEEKKPEPAEEKKKPEPIAPLNKDNRPHIVGLVPKLERGPVTVDEEIQQITDLVEKETKSIKTLFENDMKHIIHALSKQVEESHAILISGVEHMSALTESELMELKYIVKPPDDSTFKDFSACSYDYNDKMKAQVEALCDKVGINMYEVVLCNNQHCDLYKGIQDTFKEENKKVGVVACMLHHYQVVNMNHVHRESESSFETEEGQSMFFYVLRNGI